VVVLLAEREQKQKCFLVKINTFPLEHTLGLLHQGLDLYLQCVLVAAAAVLLPVVLAAAAGVVALLRGEIIFLLLQVNHTLL
jgi:hypothetical protein